jgi:hypothetical protein
MLIILTHMSNGLKLGLLHWEKNIFKNVETQYYGDCVDPREGM